MEYVINRKTVVVLYSLMLCSSQQASKRNVTPSLTKALNPSTDFLDLGFHVCQTGTCTATHAVVPQLPEHELSFLIELQLTVAPELQT